MAEEGGTSGAGLNLGAVTGRKVLGVPFLYWAVGVVVVVVGYGYVKKRGAAKAPAATDAAATNAGGDVQAQTQPVFQAIPVPAYDVTATPVNAQTGQPLTNTDWTRLAVQWLTTNHQMTSGDALALVQSYLNGDTLSMDQSKAIDSVVHQYGLPPELPPSGGTSTPPPAATKETKQGVPPIEHTVKGSNTTVNDLSLLYYGTTNADVERLIWEFNYMRAWDQFATAGAANAGGTVLPAGTKVTIPAYIMPKYFKARAGALTSVQIARLNGTDYRRVELLNADKIKQWPVKVGTSVRVQ